MTSPKFFKLPVGRASLCIRGLFSINMIVALRVLPVFTTLPPYSQGKPGSGTT